MPWRIRDGGQSGSGSSWRWSCWPSVAWRWGWGGLRVSCAEVKIEPADNAARQVTVFAIVATPGSQNGRLEADEIKSQLDKFMPQHGFKLLDVQSKRLVTGESVTCDLRNGYTTR